VAAGARLPVRFMDVCTAAGGHLKVLQWLWEHGCPCWGETMCEEAAFGGHLEVLKWLRAHGCTWGEATCHNAVCGGHVQVLKWAREHHCPWDASSVCAYAALYGHRGDAEVGMLGSTTDCPWDRRTCILAHRNRHLEELRWAQEHDAP